MENLPATARETGGDLAYEEDGDDAPLPLRDLDFTDLYISETGEAFMQGLLDFDNPLYEIPDGAISDLEKVWLQVCQLGQDKRAFTIDHDGVRYRVQKIRDVTNPTYAMRRMPPVIPRLRSFGLNPHVHRALGQAGNSQARGLILFTGATGQGKTTTASSLLQEYLLHYGGVAVAVEDPPELKLSGRHGHFGRCFQVEVENGDFTTPLKEAMRQRPRYIYLGEIRDPASAAEALQACNSGHIVIATTHAGTIEEALNRLMKLVSAEIQPDLARDLLADTLSVVVNQELRRVKTSDGRADRKLLVRSLFFGADQGLRSKVREGKIHLIKSDIEAQAMRVLNGEGPLGTPKPGAKR